MLYKTFPEIVQRVREVKIYTFEYALIFITGFLGILLTAIFDNKLWLVPFSTSFVIDGVLMVITQRGLVVLAAGEGPTKEVFEKEAVTWGVFYIIIGSVVSAFLLLV